MSVGFWVRWVLPIVAMVALAGCGGTPKGMDEGGVDGGAADGGAADGGSADGGAADGGSADGGAADGGSADGGSADGAAVNQPPTPPVVALSPERPGADEELALVFVEPAVDPDGDAVSYSVAWLQDGVLRADLTGEAVPASETTRGERWAVQVVATDGALSSAAAEAEVLIENSPPSVASVEIGPEPAFEHSELVATVVGAADVDGDALRFSYGWTVNGAVVAGATGDRLTGADFDKGDVVQVTVIPDDGAAAGAAQTSPALTVQNTPPTAPSVAIRPAEPIEGEPLVCGLSGPATDADGDPLTYRFDWTVDGLAYSGAIDGAWPGDTVPGGETAADEAWVCAVSVDDGEHSGPSAEDEVRVERACGSGQVSLSAAGVGLVAVCGGTFDMGCTPGQSSCDADEAPVRATTLSHDYYLSQTEITQGEFLALMGYNPSFAYACGLDCPVEYLTWHESAAFANAVSADAGLPACYSCTGSGPTVTCSAPSSVYACAGYRLPTEAEWEGAARCGEDRLYAGGDDLDLVAWAATNSGARAHAVGGLAPNACGLLDMSGNLFEWTSDWDSEAPYAIGAATDPTGPASGTYRHFRGGSYAHNPQQARVANRASDQPTVRSANRGLRLARTAP